MSRTEENPRKPGSTSPVKICPGMVVEPLRVWQVQEAKARFSELLKAALEKGPQAIARRGLEAAVLVPIQEWRRLQQASRAGLKELLLAPDPRFGGLVRRRGRLRRRPGLDLG